MFTICQTYGRRNLGAGEVKEPLKMWFRFLSMARALKCPCQCKLRRRMKRIDLDRLGENSDGLIEFFLLLVADTLVVVGIRVLRIDRHYMLKTL